jgi:hypothetical protein
VGTVTCIGLGFVLLSALFFSLLNPPGVQMPAGEVRECILLGGEHRGKGYFLSLEKLGLLLQVQLPSTKCHVPENSSCAFQMENLLNSRLCCCHYPSVVVRRGKKPGKKKKTKEKKKERKEKTRQKGQV